MDISSVPSLLVQLSSDEDGFRKMGAFRLQSSINDPSFAEAFVFSGGLSILHRLIMTTSANTLAYSLQSLAKILEVDMGWEMFEASGAAELIAHIIELIVTPRQVVNILRGAMSICAAVVGHPYQTRSSRPSSGAFGFRAIKPAIETYTQFYDVVVQQLDSADHTLCGNAIYLLNVLIRDVLTNNDAGEEWPRFIARLENLGVMDKAKKLMRSSGLQDLAHPLLETQILAKMILKNRRDLVFDQEIPLHRRMLKMVYASSKSADAEANDNQSNLSKSPTSASDNLSKGSSSLRHNPHKWRRLGFSTESPARDFESSGYLAVRDLEHYATTNSATFQKILQEQAVQPVEARCPIARCSQYVTWLLYNHFDCDNAEDQTLFRVLESDKPERFDEIFKPLIFEWPRLHVACLTSFNRLWAATSAKQVDFDKIVALVHILIQQVIGIAARTDSVHEVEERMVEMSLERLREQQMKDLNDAFEHKWEHHLSTIRDKAHAEGTEFMREQRIRCLTAGAWFPFQKPSRADDVHAEPHIVWRYARLSTNKRYLHYRDFDQKEDFELKVAELPEKIRISEISSVAGVGLIHPQHKAPSAATIAKGDDHEESDTDGSSSAESTSTIQPTRTRGSTMTKVSTKLSSHDLRTKPSKLSAPAKSVKSTRPAPKPTQEDKRITIRSLVSNGDDSQIERVLLTLTCPTQELACEWLDGLLMLLGMEPKTEETKKLIEGIVDYGLRIRLLNVKMENMESDEDDEKDNDQSMNSTTTNGSRKASKYEVPSREGVDGDYYYA